MTISSSGSFTNIRPIPVILIVFSCLFSCNHGVKNSTQLTPENNKLINNLYLESPAIDEKFSLNDSLPVHIEVKREKITIDSAELYLRGEKISTSRLHVAHFNFRLATNYVGKQEFRIRVYYNDSLSQTLSARVVLLSPKKPAILKYKKINQFPHDKEAFIEGLYYNKGYLFEGTGQNGKSFVRKIEIASGKILQEIKLDQQYFGEGIALLNDQIFQLTYTTRVGFVYNANTFELIRKFEMQTAEGWGLTTNGQSLIASDGSSNLYFYEPENYSQIKQIEVADDQETKKYLNELEYVSGYIWANIYGQPTILKINAESGQVEGILDLSELIPKELPSDLNYVLNGIAYNPNTKTYYITGKHWPVLYEIAIF